jgi:hypothetical protein
VSNAGSEHSAYPLGMWQPRASVCGGKIAQRVRNPSECTSPWCMRPISDCHRSPHGTEIIMAALDAYVPIVRTEADGLTQFLDTLLAEDWRRPSGASPPVPIRRPPLIVHKEMIPLRNPTPILREVPRMAYRLHRGSKTVRRDTPPLRGAAHRECQTCGEAGRASATVPSVWHASLDR